MRRPRRWSAGAALATLVAALIVPAASTAPAAAAEPATDTSTHKIVAVGDIACDPGAIAYKNGLGTPAGCRQRAVGDVVKAANPEAFLALGDLQYYDGTYEKFMTSYDPAFGSLKPVTRPIPGNHEYKTPKGAGYYQYFGDAAHPETKGTYSFTMGQWHIIAINSMMCTRTMPCGPNSSMGRWLASTIAQNPTKCVMAMWHHPLWSAGAHGNYIPMATVWNQLYDYGADVVLTGHDHLYQRFHPAGRANVDENGVLAAPTVENKGMTEFVVGTGGEDNYQAGQLGNAGLYNALAAFATNPNPAVFGALQMNLGDGFYDYSFLPAAGTTFQDTGTASCREKTPPVGVPNPPSNVSVQRAGDGMAKVSWETNQAANTPAVNYIATVDGSAIKCVSTGTNCTLSGLKNGRSYTFRVRASNTVSETTSPPSETFVPAVKPTPPGKPTVTVLSNSSLSLSWAKPNYDGGLPITGYTAYSNVGGYTCTATTATSCTINNMKAGKYYFTVAATNDVGPSNRSQGSDVVNMVGMPRPAAPSIASVTRAGDGAVKAAVTPDANDGAMGVTSYTVVSTPGSKHCTITVPSTTNACTVSGLVNGTSYTFTAKAVAPGGDSPVSAPSAPLVVGRQSTRPLNVTSTVSGERELTVNWTKPDWNGGLPITSYTATSNVGGFRCTTNGETSCKIGGLTAGTYYSFTVTATNDFGPSAGSVGSPSVRAATLPGVPSITSVTKAAAGSVTVAVKAPTNTGFSPITGYTVTSVPEGKTCQVTGTATSCTVEGLTPGTPYRFTAVAKTLAGSSAASAQSAQIVP